METNCISHKQRSFCTGKYLVGWAYNSLEHAIACLVVEPDRQVCPDCFKVALQKRYAGEIPTEPVFAPHLMNALRNKPTVPAWVLGWRGSGDTGVSSKAICYHMLNNPDLLALHRANDRMDAPYDCWDLGRCVRLLDLAHDKGEDWRERIEEMAIYPKWNALIPRWSELEAMYRRDMQAEQEWQKERWKRKDGGRRKSASNIPFPKMESTDLIKELRDIKWKNFGGGVSVTVRPSEPPQSP